MTSSLPKRQPLLVSHAMYHEFVVLPLQNVICSFKKKYVVSMFVPIPTHKKLDGDHINWTLFPFTT